MKKWIRLGLCTAVLAAALACTALAADEADGAVYGTGAVSYDGAKCSVTYSEGLTDGNQYVLLLVTNPQRINDEGVMYIDQAAAAGGQVSFEGFIPREWPGDGQTWTALLGGEFEDDISPKTIGTLTFGEGVPVSGTVELEKRTNQAGATVVLTGESSFSATTGDSGAYSFSSVAPGTYTMTITMPGYLSHTINGLNVNGPITVSSKTLYAGNINANGEINIYDLNGLLGEYNRVSSEITNPTTDLNDTGEVNIYDLTILLANYNRKSIEESWIE